MMQMQEMNSHPDKAKKSPTGFGKILIYSNWQALFVLVTRMGRHKYPYNA